MKTIDAIYQGGVFRPISSVDLPENQPVRLEIVTASEPAPDHIALARAWLDGMRRGRKELFDKYGIFPDSTELIREDRNRDI